MIDAKARSLLGSGALVVLVGSCATEPPPPCTSGESRIAVDAVQACTLWLDKEAYLSAVIEERGADVQALLRDPLDRELLRIDHRASPSGNQEPLYFVASQAGLYTLEISLADNETAGRSYNLELQPTRRAGNADRIRAASLLAFAQGRRLAREAGSAEGHERAVKLEEAATELTAAIAGWGIVDERIQAAFSWEELARVREALGQNDAAFEAYATAFGGFRSAGHPRCRRLAFELGWREEKHSLERALEWYEEQHRLAERFGDGGDQREQAAGLTRQASVLERLERQDEALIRYGEALSLWRQLASEEDVASVRYRIGKLFTSVGEHQRAIPHLEAAFEIYQRVDGSSLSLIRTLNALGDAERRARNVESSLRRFTRAMELLERRKPSTETCAARVVALLGLARGKALQEDATSALALFHQAQTALGACPDPDLEAVALGGLGMLLADSGKGREAVALLERALTTRQGQGEAGHGGQASAHFALASTYFGLGDLARARDEIQQAIEKVEELWASKTSTNLQAVYLESKQSYYDLHVKILMRLGATASDQRQQYEIRAWEITERRRARTLSDRLREPSPKQLNPELEEQERALWSELTEYEHRLDGLVGVSRNELQQREIEARLHELHVRYDTFEAEARRLTSAYRSRHRAPQLLAVQALLDQETVFLEYALGAPESFAWLVTRDDITAFRLPSRADLEKGAREAYTRLSRSRPGEIAAARLKTALVALTKDLLPPELATRLEARRLVLVKDGALHFVPFAVLPLPAGHSARDRLSVEAPLVAAHELITVPSAMVLTQLRARRRAERPATRELAVFADAVYSRDDPRLAGVPRSRPRQDRWRVDEDAFFDVYAPLPGTRREGEAILSLAPELSDVFFDFDARRGGILEKIEPYRYLHFAVHGYENPVRPEHSGLVLSRFDRLGREQTSLLSARDIHRSSLAAELVVLSACGSGLGRELRGEGLVGVAQAFLVAGAERVLVSLWDVEDRTGAVFMQHFYEEVFVHRRSPAAALRLTQLWMLDQDPRRSPYDWAGFVLQGD